MEVAITKRQQLYLKWLPIENDQDQTSLISITVRADLPDFVHDLLRVPGGGGLHAPGEAETAGLHRLRLTV